MFDGFTMNEKKQISRNWETSTIADMMPRRSASGAYLLKLLATLIGLAILAPMVVLASTF